MDFSLREVAGMIDLTAVRAEDDEAEIWALAAAAIRYLPASVFTLPAHTVLIRDLLASAPAVCIGGVVGFPSGGETTRMKAAQALELRALGCGELDMVINVGLLKSGQDQRVMEDIRAVVGAAGGAPVKVILECYHLTDDEVRLGCELSLRGGASCVKTSTGWAPAGATPHNVALIESCVGDALMIKAAGGIRSLAAIKELYALGARRFGIGIKTAAAVFAECESSTAAAPGGLV